MAKKRMFDNAIIDQDNFVDMPMSTKGLYFLLGMQADDYGFVSPRRVMRTHMATDDDLKLLIAKGFVLQFETGVIVIVHFLKNNYLNKSKITMTEFREELSQLILLNLYYL